MLAQVQDFCPGPGPGQDLTGTWPGLDLDLTWDLDWDLDWDLNLSLTICRFVSLVSIAYFPRELGLINWKHAKNDHHWASLPVRITL